MKKVGIINFNVKMIIMDKALTNTFHKRTNKVMKCLWCRIIKKKNVLRIIIQNSFIISNKATFPKKHRVICYSKISISFSSKILN